MKIAWLTDIHLDFLQPPAVEDLARGALASAPDAFLLTGDLSVAGSLAGHLSLLEAIWDRPIWFVLGNHDFYGSSIARVRDEVAELCERSRWLRWLPRCGAVALTERTGLVGHDAWADGRAGDPADQRVSLNDWRVIEELAVPAEERRARLRELGAEAAAYLASVLPAALARHHEVIVATHPPAFPEACRYYGVSSPAYWLPHLVCAAVGREVLRIAAEHPDRRLLCLAGHTHGRARERPAPNVRAWTGTARYGAPRVQRVITVA